MFAYDASSGTGLGEVKPLGEGKVSMEFDPATIDIPALNFRTTRVLGLPIPPPLKIVIDASELKVRVQAMIFCRMPSSCHNSGCAEFWDL